MAYQGKVALITGGGSGMGRLAAQQFAAAGAQVAILDVNEAGMQETAAGRDNIHPYTVDITDFAAVTTAVNDSCDSTHRYFRLPLRSSTSFSPMPLCVVLRTSANSGKAIEVGFYIPVGCFPDELIPLVALVPVVNSI